MLDDAIFIKSDNFIKSYECIAKIIKKNNDGSNKFVIVHSKIEENAQIMVDMFEYYGLETNLGSSFGLLDCRIANLINSLLDVTIFGIRRQQILNFLNCFPCGFREDEIWNFKNYLATYDIENFESDFKIPPVWNLRGSELSNELLHNINLTRIKIINCLNNLINKSEKCGFCAAAIDFVDRLEYNNYKNFKFFKSILNDIKLKKLCGHEFKVAFINTINDIGKKSSNKSLINVYSKFDFNLEFDMLFLILENSQELTDNVEYLHHFKRKYIFFYNNNYEDFKNQHVMEVNSFKL